MKRAALYIRVSTQEQAIHGLSVETQRENLWEWAKKNNVFVIGEYVDEGISARKKASKRPELQRLLKDVNAGKVDLIVFTKLDRWFRNVAEYYKVQEVLDEHHVYWQTIHEDYETETSAGQLKVNIMLSVAQNEADRTSERIKVVFKSKLARKEVISGMAPVGYKIENKHLVPDPVKAPIVRDLFCYYDKHGSKHGALQYIYDTYGIIIDRHHFQRMLHNPVYIGEFHGIKDFCEPIIEPALFNKLDAIPTARANPTKRIYIFSGLVYCAECGSRMIGRIGGNSCNIIYYRCNRANDPRGCINHRQIDENLIERWLLENIKDEINKTILDFKTQAEKKDKPAIDRAAIKRKMNRLKDLYVAEMIDMETYAKDYEQYAAQLTAIPEDPKPKLDINALQDFLSNDFETSYEKLDREGRRSFWREIVIKIRVDRLKNITISFT